MPLSEDDPRNRAIAETVQASLTAIRPLSDLTSTVDRAEYARAINAYEAEIRKLREENGEQRLAFLAERERLIRQNQELMTAVHQASMQLRSMGAGPQFKTKFAEGFAGGAAAVAVDALAAGILGPGRRRR